MKDGAPRWHTAAILLALFFSGCTFWLSMQSESRLRREFTGAIAVEREKRNTALFDTATTIMAHQAHKEPEQHWKQVRHWSGGNPVEKRMERFSVIGRPWRLRWRCSTEAILELDIKTRKGELVATAGNLDGKGPGLRVLDKPDGEYELWITADRGNWYVFVDEPDDKQN